MNRVKVLGGELALYGRWIRNTAINIIAFRCPRLSPSLNTECLHPCSSRLHAIPIRLRPAIPARTSLTSLSCLSAASRRFGSMVPRRASIRLLASMSWFGYGSVSVDSFNYEVQIDAHMDALFSSNRRERKKQPQDPDRSAPISREGTSASRAKHTGNWSSTVFCWKILGNIAIVM